MEFMRGSNVRRGSAEGDDTETLKLPVTTSSPAPAPATAAAAAAAAALDGDAIPKAAPAPTLERPRVCCLGEPDVEEVVLMRRLDREPVRMRARAWGEAPEPAPATDEGPLVPFPPRGADVPCSAN